MDGLCGQDALREWERLHSGRSYKRLAEGKFLIPHVERSDGRPATLELSEVEWHLLLDGIVVRDRVLLRRHSRTVPQATGGATMHGM